MENKNNNIKVLVALSGGVDSSVSAALLVKAGYAVEAAFFINYDDEEKTGECWLPDYRDAARVAAKLNIPIHKYDFTREYRQKVLKYMFSEYKTGRTPNPDVLCNKYIKFGVWLQKAREMGFDYLATGHYARIENNKLLEAKDANKDQTYFLHQLNPGQLAKTMFPVGDYTKPQVRALAKKFTLPTAEKAESMGICFIGEVPMKEFLEKTIPPKPGKIVTTDGKVVGRHDGLPFYTIGQRHIGIDSAGSKPLYVVSKNAKTNTLVVGYEDDPQLFSSSITVESPNWINGFIHRSSKSEDGQTPTFPLKCMVRLRHRQKLERATVTEKGKKIVVTFAKPQRAVTPGQFAVFYKEGECLGGGTIS